MPASTSRSSSGLRPLYATRLTRRDIDLWRKLHAADNGMMYALPSDDVDLWRYLSSANAYLVRDGAGCLVGGVTLSEVMPGIASIGIVVAEALRASGVGAALLALVESELALRHKFRVLRADVYCANEAAIQLLKSAGFGEYRNFEKNIARSDVVDAKNSS